MLTRHLVAADARPSDTIAALVQAAFGAIAGYRAAVTVFQRNAATWRPWPRFGCLRTSEERASGWGWGWARRGPPSPLEPPSPLGAAGGLRTEAHPPVPARLDLVHRGDLETIPWPALIRLSERARFGVLRFAG
jgi:hypothetical protein